LRSFTETTYDLLIIGGGITGAGVARDAAQRGLKVALIEARDFGEGTSSRSSKLIHGGIRYLENFQFGLVFEALRERRILFEIAPHLVHPLRFVVPVYKQSRVSFTRLGLGMWVYDLLALFESPEMHRSLGPAELGEMMPFLQTQDLVGAYEYSDAYTDDDRLVIETLRSAHHYDAHIASFVTAEAMELSDLGVSAVSARDVVTGRRFTLRARQVVSCVGPWTDRLGGRFFRDWQTNLRPTKGVHVVFSRDRLPLTKAVVMAAEKRIVFGIPRHDMVIVGTTDTDYQEDPSEVSVKAEDVSYLLGVVDRYFPGARLTASDILSTYAGVRPLVDDGAASAGGVSREHKIFRRGDLLVVTGGKYTTYRNTARQVVDEVLGRFPLAERARFRRCETDTALNPLATEAQTREAMVRREKIAKDYGLAVDEVGELIFRHSGEVERLIQQGRDYLQEPVSSRRWALEAVHAIENTMCLNLIDFYLRRTPLFLSLRDHGWSHLSCVAGVFQHAFGWDAQELQFQLNALQEFVRRERSWEKQLKGNV
jgi:glycerol-3-phosphate dehydrogenase